MRYEELDEVVLNKDLPERGLRKGDLGVVVQREMHATMALPSAPRIFRLRAGGRGLFFSDERATSARADAGAGVCRPAVSGSSCGGWNGLHELAVPARRS